MEKQKEMKPRKSCFIPFLTGSFVSLISGYSVFLLFAFILGAGSYIDESTPKIQGFFTAASIPAELFVTLLGSIISYIYAYKKRTMYTFNQESQ